MYKKNKKNEKGENKVKNFVMFCNHMGILITDVTGLPLCAGELYPNIPWWPSAPQEVATRQVERYTHHNLPRKVE